MSIEGGRHIRSSRTVKPVTAGDICLEVIHNSSACPYVSSPLHWPPPMRRYRLECHTAQIETLSRDSAMNHVERFRALMNFQPVDRLPRWEWAMWWDLTIERWHREGLPADLNDVFEISQHFGLDPYKQFWFSTTDPTIEAVQHHVEGTVSNMDDYLRIRPSLYPDHRAAISAMQPWARRQAQGEVVVWTTLEGFFWFPRTLLGFERLMLAYYDQPELIHQINHDLLEFNLRLLEQIGRTCVPTFTTIAEDMSYNLGPMVSRRICDQFLTPYYVRLLERVKDMNIITVVDTDGDVTRLVPWLQSVGVEGVLPLERQAGVDG